MQWKISLLILFFFSFVSLEPVPISVMKCVRVIDGDTVEAQNGKKIYRLRLNFIDAPEIKQQSFDGRKLGEESRSYLKKRIEGKNIQIILHRKDLYQRYLASIFLNHSFINLELVTEGMALLYPYTSFNSVAQKQQFLQSLFIAMLRHRGLWSSQGLLHPHQWRKKN